ncbi:pyruvate kinase-like protein [Lasiosphaeria miniovina]|uniref:Pyruvate kinase-like protein n=1 Tax=Lasiosphaeria miniovina TaxID=1954250 RepID=A0AA40B6E1_9PEZI|nr:pyruvate kinase-like protein [Lasiosphaeria miniovina]KAK0728516.1 pyruvate kinase-like protein [Lasiosphaeria miniovina]
MAIQSKTAAAAVVAAAAAAVDLDAPFTRDTLLEVRAGKMRPMPGLPNVLSGIDKTVCGSSPVHISRLGIDGDEHDLTFHGGPEKAIHGYCSSHYAAWRAEFPAAADRFVPGAFGENFVTAQMNERNVCIGDVMAVGGSSDDNAVLLEVSLPRQPCYKLNHRFQHKNFAPNTWKTSRTGWYFRVRRDGTVKAGDEIRLVERKHPKWTLERVQEYLHRTQDDAAMNEELAGIEALGPESRNVFKGRMEKQQKQALRDKTPAPKLRDFRVVEKKRQAARISSFVLEAVEPIADEEDADLDTGAHASIKLGNGLVRAYSVVDGDRNRFQLGVALASGPASRGGSRYMHNEVEVGSVLQVSAMTAAVPFAGDASHRVFVAAGVGLTAFLAQVELCKSINYSATLHYAVRSAEDVPFRERLDKLGDWVVLYDKSAGQRLDVGSIIADRKWNSKLYFCGPKLLMEEAARETRVRGIPESEVHFEAFSADVSGDPFEAVVANKGGKVLQVGEEETLLEALQKCFDVPSSCSVGNCGTCKISLQGGRVDHRGTALTVDEKATSMLSCVSRGIGRITIEI